MIYLLGLLLAICAAIGELTTTASNQVIYGYSFEVTVKGESSLWPIIHEYLDGAAFKVGNLSLINSARSYLLFILTPYGQLRQLSGNDTGFDDAGNWGTAPTSIQETYGFSIENDKLFYNGSDDWTLCPKSRGSLFIYTIQFNSSCEGGSSTSVELVSLEEVEDQMTTASVNIFTLHLPEFSATLSNNSFKSYSFRSENTSSSYSMGLLMTLIFLAFTFL